MSTINQIGESVTPYSQMGVVGDEVSGYGTNSTTPIPSAELV